MSRGLAISTRTLAPHRKMHVWNEAVSATLTHAAAEPLDAESFQAEMRGLVLGDVRLATISAGPSLVRRLPLSRRAARCVFTLVLSGELQCHAAGLTSTLRTGDLWLYAPLSSAELVLQTPVTLLALSAPGAHLAQHICCSDIPSSRIVRSTDGTAPLVADYLRSLWARLQTDLQLPPSPRFADVALQMLGTLFSERSERPADAPDSSRLHRMRISAYIEANLRDPDLTPAAIAAALGITCGYLHRLFSRGGESVARYILRRRLECAHHRLSDGMPGGRQVASIAFDCGFESLGHFCRVFKAQYGIPPGVFRRRATAALGPPATD